MFSLDLFSDQRITTHPGIMQNSKFVDINLLTIPSMAMELPYLMTVNMDFLHMEISCACLFLDLQKHQMLIVI